MTSLSTGASRRVPVSSRHRASGGADLGRPDIRWRRARTPLGRALLRIFFAVAAPLATWQQRLRDRDTLRQLPDYILRDIGADPLEVEVETRKPFWRA